MKLKYYLRGLGIGIVGTAIIMGISLGGKKETLSDAEVRQRAKSLGMVESGVLSDITKEETPEVDVPEAETPKENPEETSEEDPQEPVQEESTDDVTLEDETTSVSGNELQENLSEQAEPIAPPVQEIRIVVEPGESSWTISKKLEAAGLVSSAAEYDDFLCQNGYDKRIKVGSHAILVGSNETQVADAISSQP